VPGSRYEILDLLDRGGLGEVYLARDLDLDRIVAIKVLADANPSPDAVDRLRDEARIIARLEHPGIVPVHDAGRLPDGRVFYAMKRVTGSRLDRAAAAASLTQRLRWFERICEPVAFAHGQRVLHRDLKPENVMVGALGEVLVLDWGLAAALGKARPAPGAAPKDTPAPGIAPPKSRWIAGTPGYMSPEQARGESARLDERSDIYSLGALLHFLLVGAPPTPGAEGRDGRTVLREVAIPRPLESICLRALATNPEDRYATVLEMRDDVGRFLVKERVLAHRESAWERAARQAERYRVPLALIGAYLVMRLVLLFVSRRP